MTLSKMSLGAKIYLGQGLTTAFLLVLGVSAVWYATSTSQTINTDVANNMRKAELAGAITTSANAAQSSVRGVMLGSLTGNAQEVQSSMQSVQVADENLNSALNEIGPLLVTAEGKRTHAALKQAFNEWQLLVGQFDAHVRAQRFDEATKILAAQMAPVAEKMRADSTTLTQQQNTMMEQTRSRVSSAATFWRWLAVLLCLVSLGVAAGAFWVARDSTRVLRKIATEIAEGARQVASASQQVSSSSQALAQGSSEQAASLEETSASTEEINSMTQKNAENARTTAEEMDRTDHLLKDTDERLKRMLGSMQQINTSSEKISKIIRVIDEIAFQTNILALNAAVEAARAGEAGMGFAVVADEVRNLAQRCAQAAKDTSDLIEESIESSNEGKERLDKVAASVASVFEAAARGKLLASEVHLGSQEQARGIEQIAKAVTQMQQLTQATAASAEESASAGEEMSAQANALEDAVSRLRDMVGGDEMALRTTPPVAVARQFKPVTVATRTPSKSPVSARAEIPLDADFKDF